MEEHVRAIDLGVTWEPNAPDAVLMSDDSGQTALSMYAHFDDSDQRCVVLLWRDTRFALMGGPNDEAIAGHRLYSRGLDNVLWAGQVEGSELIASLERQNSLHPRHDPRRFVNLAHHVVLLKEATVEVVADSLTVHRFHGTSSDAAAAALRR